MEKLAIYLPKLSRHIGFLSILLFTMLLVILDSMGVVSVRPEWISMLTQLLMVIVGVLYVSRSAEKISSMKYKSESKV